MINYWQDKRKEVRERGREEGWREGGRRDGEREGGEIEGGREERSREENMKGGSLDLLSMGEPKTGGAGSISQLDRRSPDLGAASRRPWSSRSARTSDLDTERP